MATRYTCDVCGSETRNMNELQQITRDYKRNGFFLVCDLCEKCADKLFKPVKEWHSIVTVELKLEEEDK